MLSGHGLQPLIGNLGRFCALAQDDIDALQRLPFSTTSVRHGEFIVRQAEACRHSFVILSGVAARDRMNRSGSRQISGFYFKGDLVVSSAGSSRLAHDSVQVFGDPVVARISVDALTSLAAERPTIGRVLWLNAVAEASIAREWTLNVGRRDSRTRLLHLICEFAVRQERAGLGSRELLMLPFTQEQLGDALGLSAVHVNRTLQSIRSEASLERENRTIAIRNWHQLCEQADFEESYLDFHV